MATADRMFYTGRRIGLACSVMNSLQRAWNCSNLSISTKVHLYQALIRSALRYRNIDHLGRRQEYTGGFPHEVSATDTWGMLVGSCLQCRGASAIWFVNHWWHLTSSTLISAFARLDPGVPAHDALRLMVDTYEGRKTSWRRPPGRPLNVWLNKIQEDTNALLLYTLWRSEIAAQGSCSSATVTRTMRRRWWWWWWWWWWRMTFVKNGG